jgi:hypothetical protein
MNMKSIRTPLTAAATVRRWLAVAVVAGSATVLSGCYVVPVNSYPASPPPPAATVQLAPAPLTFSARLYPANELATRHGLVQAIVNNDLNGRGTFNATIGGESFVGEATRRAGSSRDGLASGAGSRGSYLSCQYTMNSATLGTGSCRLSDGAIFTMHVGH